MLKKIHRLSSVKLYNFKQIKGKYFNLKIASNEVGFSRFGFVISKKIDKKAVVRNSLKRKLSVSIERIHDKIKIGKDIIIIPGINVLELTQEELNKEMLAIFKKEKIIL